MYKVELSHFNGIEWTFCYLHFFKWNCTSTAVACDESKLHVMQYVLTCRIGVKKVYNVTPIICLFKVFLTKLNSICSKPVQSKQLLKLRLFINQGKMCFQNTWWWITGESFKFMVAQNVKLDFFCESLIHRLISLLSLQQSLLSYITY